MFPNAARLFTFYGFEIKADPSWLLIAALITWSLASQYFPSAVPGLDASTYLGMAMFGMLCFFASLLIHELAHSVVARANGVPIKSITLFLFGGVAELESEPKSAVVEFWVALAGPVASLALGAGFWVLSLITSQLVDSIALTEVLSYLALINVILAVFNLLPAFPLDGGRILRAFLWHRSGDALQATATAAKTGVVLAYGLIALGVLALFQGIFIAGFWNIMLGLFVLSAARASYQAQLAQTVFVDKTVASLMTADPVVVAPDVSLAEFVNRVLLAKRVSFVPVVEEGVLLGHMDPDVLTDIDREHWASTQVGDVFAGLSAEGSVAPDMPVAALMDRITRTGRRKFLVLDDHRLVGVVTLADLTRFLQLSQMVRQPDRNHTKNARETHRAISE